MRPDDPNLDSQFMDVCLREYKGAIERADILVVSLFLALRVHYAVVIYTHWKNSDLPKGLGGCGTNSPGT